jgi:hypothetical protein
MEVLAPATSPTHLRRLLLGLLCAATAGAAPRLTPAVPVDPRPGLEPLSSYTYSPNVTFTGSQFAMTWEDERSGNPSSYGALLELDGTVTLPGRRVLTSVDDFGNSRQLVGCPRYASCSSSGECRPGESCAAGRCLPPDGGTGVREFFWAGASMYSDSAFLRTGPQLDRRQLTHVPGVRGFNDNVECSGALPLWAVSVPTYGPDDTVLQLAWVDPDGGLLPVDGGAPLVARLGIDDISSATHALAFDGARWLLVWADGRSRLVHPDGGVDNASDIMGAFISPAGAGPAFAIANSSSAETEPQVAFDGSKYTVAWAVAGPNGRDLRAVALTPQGTVGSLMVLAATTADEHDLHLVYDGAQVVAVWAAQFSPEDVELRAATLTSTLPTAIARGWFDSVRVATTGAQRSMVTARDFGAGIREVAFALQGITPGDAGLIDPATSVTAQTRPFAVAGAAGQAVPARVVPVDPSHAHPGVLLVTRASRPRAAARC